MNGRSSKLWWSENRVGFVALMVDKELCEMVVER